MPLRSIRLGFGHPASTTFKAEEWYTHMGILRFIGNLIWFVFGGIWLGLSWVLAGLVCFITILLIPYGVACFRIAGFSFFPFGKRLVPAEWVGETRIPGTGLMNFLWALLFGWWLALWAALVGVGACLTIVGIPGGIACFHIAKASFAPLGKRTVSADVAKLAYQRHVEKQVDKMTVS